MKKSVSPSDERSSLPGSLEIPRCGGRVNSLPRLSIPVPRLQMWLGSRAGCFSTSNFIIGTRSEVLDSLGAVALVS